MYTNTATHDDTRLRARWLIWCWQHRARMTALPLHADGFHQALHAQAPRLQKITWLESAWECWRKTSRLKRVLKFFLFLKYWFMIYVYFFVGLLFATLSWYFATSGKRDWLLLKCFVVLKLQNAGGMWKSEILVSSHPYTSIDRKSLAASTGVTVDPTLIFLSSLVLLKLHSLKQFSNSSLLISQIVKQLMKKPSANGFLVTLSVVILQSSFYTFSQLDSPL